MDDSEVGGRNSTRLGGIGLGRVICSVANFQRATVDKNDEIGLSEARAQMATLATGTVERKTSSVGLKDGTKQGVDFAKVFGKEGTFDSETAEGNP
jgi:hypothetical protein